MENQKESLHEILGHFSWLKLALENTYKVDSSTFTLFGTIIPMHDDVVNQFIIEWEKMWRKLESITTSNQTAFVYQRMEALMVSFICESIKQKKGNLKNIQFFLRGTRGKLLILNHIKSLLGYENPIGRYLLTIDLKSRILQSSFYGKFQLLLKGSSFICSFIF
jgi:hypothetical protein